MRAPLRRANIVAYLRRMGILPSGSNQVVAFGVDLAEGHAHLLVERSLDRVHHGVRAANEVLALLAALREVAVEDAGGHAPPLRLPAVRGILYEENDPQI